MTADPPGYRDDSEKNFSDNGCLARFLRTPDAHIFHLKTGQKSITSLY